MKSSSRLIKCNSINCCASLKLMNHQRWSQDVKKLFRWRRRPKPISWPNGTKFSIKECGTVDRILTPTVRSPCWKREGRRGRRETEVFSLLPIPNAKRPVCYFKVEVCTTKEERREVRKRPADINTNVNKVIGGKDERIDHSIWQYLYEKNRYGVVVVCVCVCVQMSLKVYSAVSPLHYWGKSHWFTAYI